MEMKIGYNRFLILWLITWSGIFVMFVDHAFFKVEKQIKVINLERIIGNKGGETCDITVAHGGSILTRNADEDACKRLLPNEMAILTKTKILDRWLSIASEREKLEGSSVDSTSFVDWLYFLGCLLLPLFSLFILKKDFQLVFFFYLSFSFLFFRSLFMWFLALLYIS